MSEHTENEIIHRTLDTTGENPAAQIAEIVSELENKDHADLSTMYECADHVVDHIFSTPPAPEAQIDVSFSYEGYRITVDQSGDVKLVKTELTPD